MPWLRLLAVPGLHFIGYERRFETVFKEVTFGDGSLIYYQYDDSNRLISIQHTAVGGVFDLAYTYDHRDLPLSITESGSALPVGITTFTYDNRGRLTSEVRTGSNPYNLSYEYDQGGNRTKKI